jgi:hypothetical protein
VDVRFGERIQLMGYDVELDAGCRIQDTGCRIQDAGDIVDRGSCIVHLTLYWRALAPVDRDYTVFVHLLDEDLKIWAGSDGQPLYDRAPTSRWEPGRIVADPHLLTFDAQLPPGDYLFGVGWYLLETGERLGAVGPEGWLPENRVLLEGIEVPP